MKLRCQQARKRQFPIGASLGGVRGRSLHQSRQQVTIGPCAFAEMGKGRAQLMLAKRVKLGALHCRAASGQNRRNQGDTLKTTYCRLRSAIAAATAGGHVLLPFGGWACKFKTYRCHAKNNFQEPPSPPMAAFGLMVTHGRSLRPLWTEESFGRIDRNKALSENFNRHQEANQHITSSCAVDRLTHQLCIAKLSNAQGASSHTASCLSLNVMNPREHSN